MVLYSAMALLRIAPDPQCSFSVTFGFGARPEHSSGDRNAYPVVRPNFLPTAYVVLTRETGFKSEKFDGQAH